MNGRRLFSLAAGVLALGLLTGCDQLQKQQKNRAFDRATQSAKEGDYESARSSFEDALDGTAASAEAYYRLALVEEKLRDLPGAIYHYQRYLDLSGKTTSKQIEDAKRFLKEAKFKLLGELSSGGAMMSQKDAARLRNENLAQTKKITELTSQVADLRKQRNAAITQSRAARSKTTPGPGETDKMPPGARTYIVQKGDTLDSIARHFYKDPSRAQDLLDANYYGLNGKTNLRIGQSLIIPE